MKTVYLSRDGDSTTVLPYPLEVHEYGCGVIEINWKILRVKNGGKQELNNTNLYLCCNIGE